MRTNGHRGEADGDVFWSDDWASWGDEADQKNVGGATAELQEVSKEKIFRVVIVWWALSVKEFILCDIYIFSQGKGGILIN